MTDGPSFIGVHQITPFYCGNSGWSKKMDLIQPAFCNDFSYQGFLNIYVLLKTNFAIGSLFLVLNIITIIVIMIIIIIIMLVLLVAIDSVNLFSLHAN